MVLEELLARERFIFQLEWLLALEHRYHHVLQSGLVHVVYDPADVHRLTLDAADTTKQLDNLLACLKKAFRSTDLIAREGMSFWILTPFTELDPVMDKVRQVITTAPDNGLTLASTDIQFYLLRDYLNAHTVQLKEGEVFLQYLLQQPVRSVLA